MKYIAFLFYAVLMFCFAVVLGCSTENPICTDSFCLVSRDAITGEIIEVDESKVLALVAKDPVLVEPITPAPDTSDTTFSSIVSDVANGGTQYLNQTVTFTATVRFYLEKTGSLSLETNTEDVFFFITDREKVHNLSRFLPDSTYTFTVYIRNILPPDEEFDDYAVYSDPAEG